MEAKLTKVLRKLKGGLRPHKCINNAEEKKEKHGQQTCLSLTASPIIVSSGRDIR